MGAQLVINHYLEKYQTIGNTMTDIPFDSLPFLYSKEPDYNIKGVKVVKSYFDQSHREAVRIQYFKIYEDFVYNGVTYPNVFVGMRKDINYFDWSGQIAYTKSLQPYYFALQPIFMGDRSETVKGFSSQKQRKILKEERYAADDWLNSRNPDLYKMLYAKYGAIYQTYLRTGFKDDLLNAFEAETDPAILTVFNNQVFGMEPMTFKELIIINLQ
jgi:hypothetical protein